MTLALLMVLDVFGNSWTRIFPFNSVAFSEKFVWMLDCIHPEMKKFLQIQGVGLGQSLRAFPGEEAPTPMKIGEGESGGEASNCTNIAPRVPTVAAYIRNTETQIPARSRAVD